MAPPLLTAPTPWSITPVPPEKVKARFVLPPTVRVAGAAVNAVMAGAAAGVGVGAGLDPPPPQPARTQIKPNAKAELTNG